MSKIIAATIQARMGSSRLPGKVLKDILGKPMLLRQVERLKYSRLIDEIIIATTKSTKDDEIVEFCIKNKIKYFRGSEEDVLSRVCKVLEKFDIDIHIECHGDSPLIDFQIIDEYIAYFLKNQNYIDFLSNSIKTTYPPGTEFSIYKSSILLKTNKIVQSDDKLREHAGYNICRYPKKFKLKSLEAHSFQNFPNIFLEVDTAEDLIVIREIFNYFLSHKKTYFNLSEILSMLSKNKELIQINNKVDRRWKKFRKN